jgi:ribosomal protein RSM22 (predicted rRNA methylase)
MSFPLPAALREASTDYASGIPHSEIARRVAAMSEHYRAGGDSDTTIASEEDVAAYLMARLPATYAAVSAASSAARRLMPTFAPSSLLDLCAGPGTASLAALAQWGGLRELVLVDANPLLLDAARLLLGAVGRGTPLETELVLSRLAAALERSRRADLVIMSYALVEMPEAEIEAVARRVFARADGLAIFVEPGTPEGFRRLLRCRDALLAEGAHLVAPCPHARPCPMVVPQWCHFAERLARSREHRLAKAASTPFEDEPYSYLAFGRRPVEMVPEARIVSRVRVTKVQASCLICGRGGGLSELVAARRDRAAYARLRRLDWGDELVAQPRDEQPRDDE